MNGEHLLGKSPGSNLEGFLRSWEAAGEFLGLLGEPLGASRSLLGLFLDLWDALGEIFW